MAVSLCQLICRYVNPIALSALGWKYYLVSVFPPFQVLFGYADLDESRYDCWLAFELVFCYLFVVETKNHTLEETALLVHLICLRTKHSNYSQGYSMEKKVSKHSLKGRREPD